MNALDDVAAWRARLERTCGACGCRSIRNDGVCVACGATKAAPTPECPACVDALLSGRRGAPPMPSGFFARSPHLCREHLSRPSLEASL